MKKQAIKVLMLGFDERTQKTFEVFFRSTCHGDYIIDKTGAETSIAIVDFDAAKARKTVDELRQKFPQQVVIALSILENSSDDPYVLFIRKPLDHQALKQQLTGIKKAIAGNSLTTMLSKNKRSKAVVVKAEKPSASKPNNNEVSHTTAAASLMTMDDDLHFVGENEDVDLNDPEALQRISYAPTLRYQTMVIKAVNHARKSGNTVELISLRIGIAIDPVRNLVLTSAGDSRLRPVCMLKVEKADSLREITGDYNDEEIRALSKNNTQPLHSYSIESFVWRISLWSSRGCLPGSVDVNTAVYLNAWPNLTRLQNFPHAMRIAALLTQKPVVLRDIPRQLNISQRYVFSFISAVQALGMLRISQRKVDQTFDLPAEQKKPAPRSLLKKLLGRLIGSPEKQAMVS